MRWQAFDLFRITVMLGTNGRLRGCNPETNLTGGRPGDCGELRLSPTSNSRGSG